MTDTGAASGTPLERAAQLGVDYERLRAAVRRLRLSMYLVDAIAAVITGMAIVVWTVFGGELWSLVSPLGLALGILIGLIAALLPTVLVGLLLARPRIAALPVPRQQSVAAVLLAATGVLLLWLALQPVPGDWRAGLLFGFALCVPGAPLAAQMSVTGLIEKGHPKLEFLLRQMQELPAAQTVLGGSIRWMTANYAIGLVEATGIAFAVAAMPPVGVLVVLLVRAVVWAFTCWLEFTRGPLASALAGGAFAVAALAVGIASLALS